MDCHGNATSPCHACVVQAHKVTDRAGSHAQPALAKHFGVESPVAHRALDDTVTLMKLMPHLLRTAGTTVDEVLLEGRHAGMITAIAQKMAENGAA